MVSMDEAVAKTLDSVERLQIQDGDLVVFRAEKGVDPAMFSAISKAIRGTHPSCKVLVLTSGVKVEVLSESHLRQLGLRRVS